MIPDSEPVIFDPKLTIVDSKPVIPDPQPVRSIISDGLRYCHKILIQWRGLWYLCRFISVITCDQKYCNLHIFSIYETLQLKFLHVNLETL